MKRACLKKQDGQLLRSNTAGCLLTSTHIARPSPTHNCYTQMTCQATYMPCCVLIIPMVGFDHKVSPQKVHVLKALPSEVGHLTLGKEGDH